MRSRFLKPMPSLVTDQATLPNNPLHSERMKERRITTNCPATGLDVRIKRPDEHAL